jgi:hypothetical protein
MKRRLAFAGMLLLSQGLLGMDCVDGVTPDCTDAAAQCGPFLDSSVDVTQPLPEAGGDSGGDAGADVDAADAGDEG